jgi:hypothetical protein
MATNIKTSDYFYIPKNDGIGSLSYVVDADGNALFLIKKSNLPIEIQQNLIGGDDAGKTYADYLGLNDVYGVTSDLKVYYCSNGKESILGVDETELDLDDPNRTVFENGSIMANFIKNLVPTPDLNGDGKISANEIMTVKKITLDSSSGITSLKELYNFSGLKELVLNDVALDSLDGLENIPYLEYISFNGTTVNGEYKKLANAKKLKYVYILNTNDTQVSSILNAMKDTEYAQLEYFGCYDNEKNVTNVSLDIYLNLKWLLKVI